MWDWVSIWAVVSSAFLIFAVLNQADWKDSIRIGVVSVLLVVAPFGRLWGLW